MTTSPLQLCLITHAQTIPFSQYKNVILQAIEGGVTMIQLRDKTRTPSELHTFALQLKALLVHFSIPLIINDHLDLAYAINADGIHLGQGDGSITGARRLLGPDKIIGLSVETHEELAQANQLDELTYVAASAVFSSTTKPNCKTMWGLEGLRQFVQQSRHPVMAIGGIHQRNIKAVMNQGVAGVAVISAIHSHRNPKMAAQQLIYQINNKEGCHASISATH